MAKILGGILVVVLALWAIPAAAEPNPEGEVQDTNPVATVVVIDGGVVINILNCTNATSVDLPDITLVQTNTTSTVAEFDIWKIVHWTKTQNSSTALQIQIVW